eukprot:252298-Pelagomonas_calceolata.AAC.3
MKMLQKLELLFFFLLDGVLRGWKVLYALPNDQKVIEFGRVEPMHRKSSGLGALSQQEPSSRPCSIGTCSSRQKNLTTRACGRGFVQASDSTVKSLFELPVHWQQHLYGSSQPDEASRLRIKRLPWPKDVKQLHQPC